tara:strand:- start:429 stop:830 length:402 start_codon:yes stop_codon:yes gene_type:complete
MKIRDILGEKELKVVGTDAKSTTLEDPITKVKTVVPKDPNKPGMISKDPATNKFTLNTKTTGRVDNEIKPGENVQVAEKAVSRKQQRFMGMVHAAQKGEKAASGEVAKVASSMKKKDAKDFASTKHKGLPEKK